MREKLKQFLLEMAVNAAFLLCFVLQTIVLMYLGYIWVYQEMAQRPGARDGMGLLLVMVGILVGSILISGILSALEAGLLKCVLPWWEPPDVD